jgi:hypothetical protein
MPVAVVVMGLVLTASTIAVNGANFVRILKGGQAITAKSARFVSHKSKQAAHKSKIASKAVVNFLK